jgi:hypothetical protein
MAMSEEQQQPHFQEMHFALLEAIRKYEQTTGWGVADLQLIANEGVSDVKVHVIPKAPASSR